MQLQSIWTRKHPNDQCKYSQPIEFSDLKLCSDHNEQPELKKDIDSPHPDDVSSHSEETDSVARIDKSLREIIGESCRSLMDTLCQEYIHSGDYSGIWNVLSKVEELESWVCKLHWQQYWDDPEDPTKGIFERIQSISRVLENLLTHAMEGVDMRGMYKRGVLLFQNYPLDAVY